MSSSKSAPIEQAVLDLHEVQYELTATAKMLAKPRMPRAHVNDLEEMAIKSISPLRVSSAPFKLHKNSCGRNRFRRGET